MNAAMGSTIVLGALAFASSHDDAPVLLTALQAAAVEPTTTVQLVMPIDVVELTKAVFTGLAAIGSAFAAIYAVVGAASAKRAEVSGREALEVSKTTAKQIDGLLTQRDTAKVIEGQTIGAAAAARIAEALKEGQRIGAEAERASVAAANPSQAVGAPGLVAGDGPVPVTDEAAQRVAKATETLAAVAQKTMEKDK